MFNWGYSDLIFLEIYIQRQKRISREQYKATTVSQLTYNKTYNEDEYKSVYNKYKKLD